MLRVGENEHCIAEPAAGISVRLLPRLRARSETIVGAVAPVVAVAVAAPVGTSPVCNATAVYPRVVDATIRPVLPSAVVNWLPVIVSVVSPVSPRASQLNVPAYVPERSVCSEAMLAVCAGAVVWAGVSVCAGICAGSVCPGAGIASAGVVVWSPVAVVLVLSALFFFEVLFFGVCLSAGCVCGVAGAGSCAFSTRTSPTISDKASVTRSNTDPDILLRMDVSSRVRYAAQSITDAPVRLT
jgi:hypothetical protein